MRFANWQVWLSLGAAGVFAVVVWGRVPSLGLAAPASALSRNTESPMVGGAPVATAATAPVSSRAAATADSAVYGLVEGTAYRPLLEPGGMGHEGYQIFNAVVAGDVNGDGRDDLVATTLDGNIHVLLQSPQGGLSVPSQVWHLPFDGMLRPQYPILLDFNGDHVLDIAVSSGRPRPGLPGGYDLLLSDGQGGLNLSTLAGPPYTGYPYGTMDLDQDGHADIVSTGQYPATSTSDCGRPVGEPCLKLLTQYGNGSGGIRESGSIALGRPYVRLIALRDYDGDGRRDLIYADSTTPFGANRIVARKQLPGGGLSDAIELHASTNWLWHAVGDFTGDGRLDTAGGGPYIDQLFVRAQWADGSFTSQPSIASHIQTSEAMLAADFDGDGRTDLVSVIAPPGYPEGDRVLAYYLQGDGMLTAPRWNGASHGLSQMSSGLQAMTHGDFNGDGCRDVAIAGDYTGVLLYYGQNCSQAVMSSGDCRTEQILPLASSMPASVGAASMRSAPANPVAVTPISQSAASSSAPPRAGIAPGARMSWRAAAEYMTR
ncbi:FG-GAP repeat domain-containing protein [Lysobacter sp. CA199]|uniref:FG-GAP repeat domain-containing protein n=1 Tax=Lysobacter sp. CA199 TaxID=3455608 RepID=UPI003F8D6C13